MTEALTESFCERCGTRYEFAVETQLSKLRKTRGLISGLKNYILSQEALGDAVGDAMRGEQEAVEAGQLDAFHQTFNFCMQCRQYTCLSCWNDDAGRCRTCVPVAGRDDLLERLEASTFAGTAIDNGAGLDGAAPPMLAEIWPDADLPPPKPAEFGAEEAVDEEQPDWLTERLAQMQAEAAWVAEAERAPEAEPSAAVEPHMPEPMVEVEATEPMPEAPTHKPPVVEPPVVEPPVVQGPMVEPPILEPLPPEVTLPLAAQAPAAEPLPPEPILAAAPEPVAPPAPRPRRPIVPLYETILRPTPAPPPEPIVPAAPETDTELAARAAQLAGLGIGDTGTGTVAPSRGNVLPYRSSGAPVRAAAEAQEQVWAASVREMTSAPGTIAIRGCDECGLSLSASARFCRRCGTPQKRSA